jgi:hypothetical protein
MWMPLFYHASSVRSTPPQQVRLSSNYLLGQPRSVRACAPADRAQNHDNCLYIKHKKCKFLDDEHMP